MSAADILSRLEKVHRTGPGRYTARCPSHDDKGPSLAIRELDDGRILLHCFAGCSVHQIVGAVGLEIQALFPPREIAHGKPERRPFPAADVLRCIGFEALVVVSAAAALLTGHPFGAVDRERLSLASGRIQAALRAAGADHE